MRHDEHVPDDETTRQDPRTAMSHHVHPNALCESPHIGAGTRIWAFAHVLPGARIGSDCNLCDGVFVENDVIVRDRVTVKCGVQLWDGVRLHDDVFVGPNATFTNDPFPRSCQRPDRFARTVVETGASIGANATQCRVSAYFHDIGKLNKPEYFVENASAEQNVHNNLSPTKVYV